MLPKMNGSIVTFQVMGQQLDLVSLPTFNVNQRSTLVVDTECFMFVDRLTKPA